MDLLKLIVGALVTAIGVAFAVFALLTNEMSGLMRIVFFVGGIVFSFIVYSLLARALRLSMTPYILASAGVTAIFYAPAFRSPILELAIYLVENFASDYDVTPLKNVVLPQQVGGDDFFFAGVGIALCFLAYKVQVPGVASGKPIPINESKDEALVKGIDSLESMIMGDEPVWGVNLSDRFYSTEDLAKIAKQLSVLKSISPKDINVLLYEALYDQLRGNEEESVKSVEKLERKLKTEKQFVLAEHCVIDSNINVSKRVVRKAIKKHPRSGIIVFSHGRVLASDEFYSDAILRFRESYELDPTCEYYARINIGMCHEAMGEKEEAKAEYLLAESINERDYRASLMIIYLMVENGNEESALKKCKELSELFPDQPTILRAEAVALRSQKLYKEYERTLNKIISLVHDDYWANSRLSEYLIESNRKDEAEEHVGRALYASAMDENKMDYLIKKFNFKLGSSRFYELAKVTQKRTNSSSPYSPVSYIMSILRMIELVLQWEDIYKKEVPCPKDPTHIAFDLGLRLILMLGSEDKLHLVGPMTRLLNYAEEQYPNEEVEKKIFAQQILVEIALGFSKNDEILSKEDARELLVQVTVIDEPDHPKTTGIQQ